MQVEKHLEFVFVCLTSSTHVQMHTCEQSYIPNKTKKRWCSVYRPFMNG